MKKYSGVLALVLSLFVGASCFALDYSGLLDIRTVDENGNPFPFITGGFEVEGLGKGASTFQGNFMTGENGYDVQSFDVKSSTAAALLRISGTPEYPSTCWGASSQYIVLRDSFTIVPVELMILCR